MELSLILPWPPSVNSYKRVGKIVKTKTGKLYQERINSNETKKFYFDTYILFKKTMPLEWPKFRDRDEISYEVYVSLHPPNERRYDLDNRLKVLFDGLVRGHVIKDDSQIHLLHVEKCRIIDQGQVVVRIREIA